MRRTLQLPPQQEMLYAKRLREATPTQLSLARMLQRVAFPERDEYSEGTFIPAPLYVDQAYTLSNSKEYFIRLLELMVMSYEAAPKE